MGLSNDSKIGFRDGVRSINIMRKLGSSEDMKEFAGEQFIDSLMERINDDAAKINFDGREFHACWCVETESEAHRQLWREINGTYYDYYKHEMKNILFDGTQYREYCQMIADELYDNEIRICKASGVDVIGQVNLGKAEMPNAMLVGKMLCKGLNQYVACK